MMMQMAGYDAYPSFKLVSNTLPGVLCQGGNSSRCLVILKPNTLPQWARYPRSENSYVSLVDPSFPTNIRHQCSWEPSANLSQCQRLLSSFWKHVDAGGDPNQDHFPGEIVQADKLWIGSSHSPFSGSVRLNMAT